jgi:hypothetical protein
MFNSDKRFLYIVLAIFVVTGLMGMTRRRIV